MTDPAAGDARGSVLRAPFHDPRGQRLLLADENEARASVNEESGPGGTLFVELERQMLVALRTLSPGVLLLFAAAVPAGNEPALEWQPTVEIALGRGMRGPWRQNDSKYDYVDDPTVAISDEGVTSVAWVDQAQKDIFFQSFAPDGSEPRGRPVNVSRSSATFSWLPRVVFAPDGRDGVYVLWQEIIFSGGSHGGDILFARSQDGGATFLEPINLSRSVGGDGKGRINAEIWSNGSLDIVAGPDGLIVAAWTEYHGPLWTSRSTDGGHSFSPPQRVTGNDAKPARGPSLARRADGAIFLAWTTGEDRHADILVAKSPDGGATFGEASTVAATRGYSDAPKLAIDSRGTVHLVYAESSDGPFSSYRVVYTRSTGDAHAFTTPKPVSLPAPGAARSAAYPSLSVDSNDNLYVLWETSPDLRERPRGLGLAMSWDAGKTFTPPIAVPESVDPRGGTNGSHQGLLMKKLAVSRSGRVSVVNSSLKENVQSRVWLMRTELLR